MEEVQRSEKRATLEDIMYASVLEKFLELGVDMLGSMDLVQVLPTARFRPQICRSKSSSEHSLKIHNTRGMVFDFVRSGQDFNAAMLPA